MKPERIVHLLDDEPGMLKALSRILGAAGFEARTHSSAREFLNAYRPEEITCLVSDVDMPDLDGLELQRQLNANGTVLPVIFLTGHGDISMSVRAMKEGAMDFLTKPVNGPDLLHAVQAALERAVSNYRRTSETADTARRYGLLTPREREVMGQVVTGGMNKQIAEILGAAEQTVKVHRRRVMQKMEVESIAGLVRAAQRLEPLQPRSFSGV